MPPIPRIRPFWLMVVFLSCDSTGTEFCTAMANLLPSRIRRSHDLCGHDRRSSSGFDWRFAAEDARGHESDDKPDGQWLDEGVGHVDEGVLVQLLRALYGSDLRGRGGRVQPGGLHLVNLRREVAVHEVRHEVEIQHLPHGDVANGGDQRDQDAAGEGPAEGDLPAT